MTSVLLSGPEDVLGDSSRRSIRAMTLFCEPGVEIYEYQDGQLHSKTLTIDGCWSMVGTPNFDARSLYLNFEVGAILYDRGIAEQLEHHFAEDLKHAQQN